MTVKIKNSIGEIEFDHKFRGEVVLTSDIIWKKLSEVYY